MLKVSPDEAIPVLRAVEQAGEQTHAGYIAHLALAKHEAGKPPP